MTVDLKKILRRAAEHPWYRARKLSDNLGDWPVLTKTDLYEKISVAPESRAGIYYSRSGGTSSDRPFFFPSDISENHVQRRRLARCLGRDGVLTSDTVAVNICPIVRMYRTMEIFTEFGERCRATILPMAALAEDDEIYSIGRRFDANTLIGMPSRLIAFARWLQAEGKPWSVPTILFGGEFLQPGKRALLQQVLETRRFSGTYGSAELGVVAWNADLALVPRYFFPKDILYVEIFNPDAEGYGAIVATNRIRKRFPIIRYDTGDVGRIVSENDDAVLIELKGRHSESFLIGDNYHSVADFSMIFSRFSEFQIQIRFDEPIQQDVIRFCLVPLKPALPPEEKKKTETEIRDLLQAHEKMYRVEVSFVSSAELIRKVGVPKTPTLVDSRGR